MKWLVLLLLLTTNLFADEDTATSTNILPNAGTTSSSMDNFNLDGVQSGSTGALDNNSTHNGFTITCPTQVQNACGTAFNGELEASYQMKVSAGGTLVGIDGVESNTTYTTTQRKLDSGIQLNSYFSIQNCEDGNSSYSCGQSNGAEDTYKLHVKIKDAQGNTLAQMTTTRLEDAGYNANSRQFHDNLVYNGTGGASYEWYWEGYDGSLNTSTSNLGPNLLGAELLLDFPIEDHEPLSTQEIKDINEALDTVNLTENEIYDIISGLESKIEEEFRLSGNLEEGTRLEINIENKEITFEVASRKTGAIVMESPMTAKIIEEMPIETLKEEMVAMVQEEGMSFMEAMEEPPEEEPKEIQAEPIIKTKSPQKEPEETTTEEPIEMAEKENEKPEEKESASNNTTASVVSSKKNIKQKKVQSKKNINEKLEKVMTKIDKEIKNSAKNLQLKNLIKMDVMIGEQLSLATYENVEFYKPKSIYLDQLNIQDTRKIYANITLAKYTDKDIIGIKQKELQLLDDKKQQLLIELEVLKNG